MKRLGYFSCLMITSILISCKSRPPQKQCGPCPLIAEIEPRLDVKFLSKTTGAPLILSPGSPYQFSDLKITSSLIGGSATFFADTTQTNNRFVAILSSQSQTFTLKLASLSPDSVRLVTKNDSPKCCPILTLKAVWLDNNLVCSPCNVSQPVTISK